MVELLRLARDVVYEFAMNLLGSLRIVVDILED